MATTIAIENSRAQARGDRRLPKFEGKDRSFEVLYWEKGDTFTIPTTFKVYEHNVFPKRQSSVHICRG